MRQATQLAYKCARAEAMCPDTHLSISARTWSVYHLFVCVILVRAAMGESNAPYDLTSPWQCFENKLDSHGSPNSGRVPISGKVFFILKKKQG